MAKRKDIENRTARGDAAPSRAAKSELPTVEFAADLAPGGRNRRDAGRPRRVEPSRSRPTPPPSRPNAGRRSSHLRWTPRHKRNALLAASVALAAALGAVVGALASGGFCAPAPHADAAGVEENQAMQQSIARLARKSPR